MTARTTGNAEVRMQRVMQTVAIPVFQFGIFSENDLSFFAGPDFNFGGRVHTNQNLYLAAGRGNTLTLSGSRDRLRRDHADAPAQRPASHPAHGHRAHRESGQLPAVPGRAGTWRRPSAASDQPRAACSQASPLTERPTAATWEMRPDMADPQRSTTSRLAL